MPITKRCCTCKETLPIEDFYNNKSNPDGKQNQCRHCMKKYRQENREKVNAAQRRYRKSSLKARQSRTDSCRRHRQANREVSREYMNNYFKEWRKNPINSRTHSIRTYLASSYNKYMEFGPKTKHRKDIWFSLEDLNRVMEFYADTPEGHVVNHIVSVRAFACYDYLMNTKISLSIINDPSNIEHITKELNSSLGNIGDDRAYVIASGLEKKYNLPGFGDLVKKTNNGIWWSQIWKETEMEVRDEQ